MKRVCSFLLFMTVSALAMAQPVMLPHHFQPGQPARSSEVNSNFEVLRQAINRGFGIFFTDPISAASAENTSVASASCPANTLVMSVNCHCSSEGGRNLGMLFSCDIAGNGGVVGCFLEPSTFSSFRPPPRGRLTLQCLGAVSNEGNRMPVTLFYAASSDSQAKSTRPKSPESQAAELSTAEQSARAHETEQLQRLGR